MFLAKQPGQNPSRTKGPKRWWAPWNASKNDFTHVDPWGCRQTRGSAFYNAAVQAWFKKEGWDHFSTEGDSKASVVERWHRTLKQRIYRYLTAQTTLKYLGALPQLINTYNTTYHRSIGMKPLEVKPSNELKVWKRLYKTTQQRVKPPIKFHSTKSIAPSKKSTYPVGPKKCFWSPRCDDFPFLLTKSVNGTARL